MKEDLTRYWSVSPEEALAGLSTKAEGLSSEEARRRILEFGANVVSPKKKRGDLRLLLAQFKSPIVLILIAAAVLSLFLQDRTGALIILVIVFVSGLLGFWQERGASNAVEKLLAIVQTKVELVRDHVHLEAPVEEIVAGDVIILSAGRTIPGDCLILESKDLHVNEAALTGETYPVEKEPAVLDVDTPLARRTNCLFMGTHVVSGTGKAVVVLTGRRTEFGKVSRRLEMGPPETEFERGVRRFGYFLMEVTLILVMVIFAFNVYFQKPPIDAFMFSLALAVGLTPQLLPAIISVNLAHGARRMAEEKVIVKRLPAIENFGSMNVLCSDKTGTLTDGIVRLHNAFDVLGREDEDVFFFAFLNAWFETGFASPIDEAIRTFRKMDISGYEKLDEVPYDFIRKRLSVLVKNRDDSFIVTKGALKNVLEVCSTARVSDGSIRPLDEFSSELEQHFEEFSVQGLRTLGVSYKKHVLGSTITRDSETDMVFLGFLTFWDPPKTGIADTLRNLDHLGVSLKVITGDNRLIADTISRQVGLLNPVILTGPELRLMGDEALVRQVGKVHVFAEVEPNQKESIISALKKAGNVVGYMGDGINDASALQAADVGISVDSAVDVAKETASIVLLEKDLGVLERGVIEGRKTFANTLKYVFMATSANFGNMFSMAGASVFLPFLPLLPRQILLTNLLTDFPEMTIATDSVDNEAVEVPRRWNIRFIRNFMLTFGVLSSVFDYLTFGVLLFIFHASPDQFRTAWFIESVVSATLTVLVIRSRRPFFRSAPSKLLVMATLLVVTATCCLPYSPLGIPLGFAPVSTSFLVMIGLIVLAYVVSAELVKRLFYRRIAD